MIHILFFYHLSLSPYKSPNFTFGFTSLIGKQYDQILDLKYKMQKLKERSKKLAQKKFFDSKKLIHSINNHIEATIC